MAELRGTLSGLELLPLVGLLADLRRTGCLDLSHDGWTARLLFHNGRLVDAFSGGERGLGAITALATTMARAEFVFMDGLRPAEAPPEPSPAPRCGELAWRSERHVLGEGRLSATVLELLELRQPGLMRVAPAGGAAEPTAYAPLPWAACPKLGFADDPGSRFARPTALHRCYAEGTRRAVSLHEQRDLCLTDVYGLCPKLRAMYGPAMPLAIGGVGATPVSGRRTPDRGQPALEAPGRGLHARGLASGREVSEGVSSVGGARRSARTTVFSTADAGGQSESEPGPGTPSAEAIPDRLAQLLPARLGPRSMLLVEVALGVALGLVILVVLTATYRAAAPAPPAAAARPAEAPAVVAEAASATPMAIAQADQASAASPTPAAAPAPVERATPMAEASSSSAKPVGAWLDTSFATPQANWRENAPFATWSDGAYRLAARIPTRFVALGAPLPAPVADVVVSATFRTSGGPPGGGYGLIIRDQEPSRRDGANQYGHFYVFELADNGTIGILRRDNDQWLTVLDWTATDAVRPGDAANDLTVRAIGNQLSFAVNGREVATQQDDANLGPGGVGVFADGDLNEVLVDRFTAAAPRPSGA